MFARISGSGGGSTLPKGADEAEGGKSSILPPAVTNFLKTEEAHFEGNIGMAASQAEGRKIGYKCKNSSDFFSKLGEAAKENPVRTFVLALSLTATVLVGFLCPPLLVLTSPFLIFFTILSINAVLAKFRPETAEEAELKGQQDRQEFDEAVEDVGEDPIGSVLHSAGNAWARLKGFFGIGGGNN
jgi:hypothetical protein